MLQFDPETHTYTWFGVEVPSLSRLMRDTCWGRDFTQVPEGRLETARIRGTQVHAAIDAYLGGKPTYIGFLSDASEPYFESFLATVDSLPLSDRGVSELPVGGWCGYGTTPDRVEEGGLIEWKANYKIYPAVWIQLAAQEYALTGQFNKTYIPTRPRIVVNLQKSGKQAKIEYDKSPETTMRLWKNELDKLQWKKDNRW